MHDKCRVSGLITAGLMQSITPGCFAVGALSTGSVWITVPVGRGRFFLELVVDVAATLFDTPCVALSPASVLVAAVGFPPDVLVVVVVLGLS